VSIPTVNTDILVLILVSVTDVTTAGIACNTDSTAGQLSATAAAGSSVTFYWTTWPSSHKGPVMTYLANCNGDCKDADATTLDFFKIDEAGLNSDGTWASDDVIANNNTWTATLPSDIAAGQYLLRHELLALHSAGSEGGAQFYPVCANLEITGSGSAVPTDTVKFPGGYSATDPGILINIYYPVPTNYTIPGPAVYTGSGSAATSAAATSAAATSAAATSAAATSAAATSAVATSAAATSAAATSAAATSAAATTAAAVAETTAAAAAGTDWVTETETIVETVMVTVTVEPSAAATTAVATTAAAGTAAASTAAVADAATTTAVAKSAAAHSTQPTHTVYVTAGAAQQTKTVIVTKSVAAAKETVTVTAAATECIPAGRYKRSYWI
jgi:cellulase